MQDTLGSLSGWRLPRRFMLLRLVPRRACPKQMTPEFLSPNRFLVR
jgi:hypothetical protein